MSMRVNYRITATALTAAAGLVLTFVAAAQEPLKPESVFSKLTWRSIGPAVMGGRTVDIEVDEQRPWVIYAAVGPSGVWRSSNNGITWEGIFTGEKTVSVGDVALVPSQPDTIWVGTGEATCRNSVTIGDGIYKSADGGKTWSNMGLGETRHISRVIVDRRHPETVFVAAMGHLWGPNEERGVFKSTDGGHTWRRVLFINPDTGAADLAQDPSDGNILYAAAYEHRRLPYRYAGGGKNSGLYKSTDGGETWRKQTKDLPQGVIGRIGVDVSRSNPNVVYVLIEHEEAGLWRSEDKGESWKRMADKKTYYTVNTRPFYYSQVRVDPSDDKVVYVISTSGYFSTDMGRTFRSFTNGTHSDHHDLWIDPQNPRHLIDGNDGGIDITYDQGKNWQAVQSIPAAEVYNIGYDLREPYWVYCGLQDNHVWGGPSATLESSGIQNSDWVLLGGGDGFYAQPDPTDPATVYANSQANNLYRFDGRIARSQAIRPMAGPREPALRFNWNSPIHISPHDPQVVYTAGNRLFVSRDRGLSWTAISPDLTTNDPKKLKDTFGPISLEGTGAETHCTITTVCESSVQAGVIWCGTDDGLLQLTRDGGQTWKNVATGIPGLPKNTWCSRVEASPFEAGTAYAAFDGHRTDDYGTYLYKTTDFGRTWSSINGDLPFGWVHVVRADRRNRDLLFVGMEFGVFASLDNGRSWFSLRNNLPTVAVHDLAVHPRDNDLLIGTHGLGIWVLDNISPLQEAEAALAAGDMNLFSVRPCIQHIMRNTRESYTRPVFAGSNPAYGLTVNIFFPSAPKTKPVLTIADDRGEETHRVELPIKEGLQRHTWNLQAVPRRANGEKPVVAGISPLGLPLVSPGTYTVTLTLEGRSQARQAVVKPDPRFEWSEEDRQAQRNALAEVLYLSRLTGLSATAVSAIRREADDLRLRLEKDSAVAAKTKAAMKAFENALRPLREEATPEEMPRGLAGSAVMLAAALNGFPGHPTETDMLQVENLRTRVLSFIDRLNAFLRKDLPALNAALVKNGLPPLKVPQEIVL